MVPDSIEINSVEYLLHLLRHRDINTRWMAARNLVDLGEDAVEPLLKRMYDNDESVRMLAIWALGRIGSIKAMGALQRAMYDDSETVQIASRGAIDRIQRLRPGL
jgi:HEAT repeat protein